MRGQPAIIMAGPMMVSEDCQPQNSNAAAKGHLLWGFDTVGMQAHPIMLASFNNWPYWPAVYVPHAASKPPFESMMASLQSVQQALYKFWASLR